MRNVHIFQNPAHIIEKGEDPRYGLFQKFTVVFRKIQKFAKESDLNSQFGAVSEHLSAPLELISAR
jgi:hypothetical protein